MFGYTSKTGINTNYHPGQHADGSELDAFSAVAVGSHIPYGTVLFFGPEQDEAVTNGENTIAHAGYYTTHTKSVMLPFADGDTTVLRGDGVTPYTYADFKLNAESGLPEIAGIAVHVEFGNPRFESLTGSELEGIGLADKGNCYYARKNCDSVTVARHGRIHVYVETDVFTNSVLGTRLAVTDFNDPLQRRGSLADMSAPNAGDFVELKGIRYKVVEGAKAGECAVIELDY